MEKKVVLPKDVLLNEKGEEAFREGGEEEA